MTFAKRNKNMTTDTSRKNKLALIAVFAMMAAYTIVLSYASIMRWASFNSSMDDMGIMIQTLHNTTQGNWLVESVNLGVPLSRLWLAHLEFIYLPLALIYKLIHRPETLLVLQSLFLALGALPVYLLARDRLKKHSAGLVFAAAYLFYPAMHNANLFDVHGIVFSTSLLLYMFYFLDRKRTGLFFLFAFLALLCREDIAVTLGMVGLYIFFIRKNRALGVTTAVVGALWFGTFYFLRPLLVDYFNAVDPAILADITRPSHWAHMDGGWLVVKRPLFFLDEYFLTGLNAKYIFWLLVPVAFLAFASPFTLAIATPILLINMTSAWLPTHLIEFQYTATITPVVFVAAIYGLENVREFLKKREMPRSVVRNTVLIYVVAVGLFSLGASLAKSNLRKLPEWQVEPRHRLISKVAKMIPEEASLSADMTLGTHAAERYEMYAFPDNYLTADYVFYDLSSRRIRLMSRASVFLSNAMPVNDYIVELLNSPEHGVAHYEDGLVLFQRGLPKEQGIQNLAIARRDEIANVVDVTIDSAQAELKLVGYTRHMDVEYDDSTFYAHYTMYWQKNGSIFNAVSQPKHYLLVSAADTTTAAWQPAFGQYPLSEWQPGEIVREEVYWLRRAEPTTVSVQTAKATVRLLEY